MGTEAPPDAVLLGAITLSNVSPAYFALPTYFSDPQGSALSYWIASNPYNNATLDESGNLSVTGSTSGLSYSVIAAASNTFGLTTTDELSVTESSPPSASPLDAITLSNYTPNTISLPSAFSDPQGCNLSYWIASNPYSNATVDEAGNLTVTGAVRGTSYTVLAAASNTLGITTTDELSVTESSPPSATPLDAISLSNMMPVTIALSSHYSDPQGCNLSYWIASDPYSNATLDAFGNLTVTGATRGVSYSVLTSASNALGGVASDALRVTESGRPAATALGILTLSNVLPATIALSSTYRDPQGCNLSYWIASNPYGNAVLDGLGNLTVTGGVRGIAYSVLTAASNSLGIATTDALHVVEPAPPRANPLGGITLSNYVPATYQGYFSDPQGCNLSYWVASNPYGSAVVDPLSGVLTVTGGNRGASYSVVAAASNAFGMSATDALSVVELAAPIAASFGAVTLSNQVGRWPLSSYFSDAQGSPLSYWLSANPLSNASLSSSNSVLSIAGAWIGPSAQTYGVAVSASNVYGQVSTDTIQVTEAATMAPSATTFGSATISYSPWTFNFADYFKDPQGSRLFYYFGSGGNPVGSATINSNASANASLTVRGNYRNSSYTVTVWSSNAYGNSNFDQLSVTEPAPVAPYSNAAFPAASLSNNAASFSLSNFFVDPNHSPLYYWLASDPLGNSTISQQSGSNPATLKVQGVYRATSNVSYTVTVGASNAYGQTAQDAVAVTQLGATAPRGPPFPNVIVGAGTTNVSLSNYVSDPNGTFYWLPSNSGTPSNVSLSNGVVSIVGSNLGTNYSAVFGASNVWGQSNYTRFGIFESLPQTTSSSIFKTLGGLNNQGGSNTFNGGVSVVGSVNFNSNVVIGPSQIVSPYPLWIQTYSVDNISLYTAGDVTSFSDARFKTDVQPIAGALDKVCAIGGYTFARVGGSPPRTPSLGEPVVPPVRRAGVMAQEVNAVLPEVIDMDGDGHMHVAYGNMVALLIEAVKELRAEVNAFNA